MTRNAPLLLRELLGPLFTSQGGAGPELNAPALDAIASLSASNLALTRKRDLGTEHGNAPMDTAFAAIREALDAQGNELLRAVPAGAAAPLTTLALERINLALHTMHGPERRKSLRFPYAAHVTLEANGISHSLRTLDISSTGLRLYGNTATVGEPIPARFSPGTGCLVTLPQLGKLPCVVRNSSDTTLNLAFTAPANKGFVSAMAGILLRLSSEQEFMAAKARELALQVGQVFETGIRNERTTCGDLFDTDYQFVPGTMPQQFTTRATAYYDAVLPALLSGVRSRIDRAAYVVATTREGYVPVHREECSLPQCVDDFEWNLKWSRNRRIYHDTPTFRAARFAPQPLVQSYPRDLSDTEADKIVMEASAPVIVRKRRWGCVQIGFACDPD